MHKVAIYRRYEYQSSNHRPMWSLVLTISTLYSMLINMK